jgi:hypothetical protein
MAGSQSEASTALSAKVAVVDSGEVGKSAVYRRYNNGPRTLPWRTPRIECVELCVLGFNLYEEVSAVQIRFLDKEIIQRERQS